MAPHRWPRSLLRLEVPECRMRIGEMQLCLPPASVDEITEHAKKARVYPTARGDRLNVSAIVTKYKVREKDFRRRQRRGWLSLNWGRLAAVRLPRSDRPGKKELTYLDTDVAMVIAAPHHVYDGEFIVNGELRMTTERVAEELGVSRFIVAKWGNGNPYLDGACMVPSPSFVPSTGRPAKTYSSAQVEQVKQKIQEVRQGRFVGDDGRAWLSTERSIRELGITGAKVTPHVLKWTWRKVHLHHLGGRPLTSRKFFFSLDHPTPPKHWYLEDDIEAIKKSLLRKAAEKRTRKRKPTEKNSRSPHYLTRFDGLIDGDPEGRRFTLRRAAAESKRNGGVFIGKWRLEKYIREGGCCWLPERTLDSKPKVIPGTTRRTVTTILESDLLRLQKAKVEGLHQIDPGPKWKTAVEICDHFGVSNTAERVRVMSMLQDWRDAGVLRAKKVRRVNADGKRGWSSPWVLDTESVRHLLAGKEIAAVASDHWNGAKESGPVGGQPRSATTFAPVSPESSEMSELSERATSFLDALFDLKAFTAAYRATVAEVSPKIGANRATLGRTAAALKRERLVDSREGRDGGYWLTSKGRQLVEQNRR